MDSGSDEDYDSHDHQQQQPPLFPHAPPLFFNTTTPPPPPPQHQLPFHLSSHHNYQNHLLYDFPCTNFNPNPTSLRSTQNPSTPSRSGALHPKPTTKKRTRASRRAPTTILTTDTINFRAMVQEFTGIPLPPFTAGASSSSSYSRHRIDPFRSSRSKVHLFSSLNNNNNNVAVLEDQNASYLQAIFPLQSVSEGIRLDSPHIPLLSALQNDETPTNCKLKFRGSSSSSNDLQRDKSGEYYW